MKARKCVSEGSGIPRHDLKVVMTNKEHFIDVISNQQIKKTNIRYTIEFLNGCDDKEIKLAFIDNYGKYMNTGDFYAFNVMSDPELLSRILDNKDIDFEGKFTANSIKDLVNKGEFAIVEMYALLKRYKVDYSYFIDFILMNNNRGIIEHLVMNNYMTYQTGFDNNYSSKVNYFECILKLCSAEAISIYYKKYRGIINQHIDEGIIDLDLVYNMKTSYLSKQEILSWITIELDYSVTKAEFLKDKIYDIDPLTFLPCTFDLIN